MPHLLPAYGRRYATQAECSKDWNDGKDFKILKGPYTSIRDAKLLQEMGDIDIWWNFGQVDKAIELMPVTGVDK